MHVSETSKTMADADMNVNLLSRHDASCVVSILHESCLVYCRQTWGVNAHSLSDNIPRCGYTAVCHKSHTNGGRESNPSRLNSQSEILPTQPYFDLFSCLAFARSLWTSRAAVGLRAQPLAFARSLWPSRVCASLSVNV